MPPTVPDPQPDPVIEKLRNRFFDHLPATAESVLDVGCGRGDILRRCQRAGMQAHGVETDAALVEELKDKGFSVSVAPAAELPFADDSFDWVCMRHIAHHLPDLQPALAQAFRVSRTGVLVAEPWFDLEIASQQLAADFQDWINGQCQRLGRIHNKALPAAAFLQAVPATVQVEVELEHYLKLQPRPAGWIRSEAASFLATLAPGDPAAKKLEEIEQAAQATGLSYNGSMILSLSRC